MDFKLKNMNYYKDFGTMTFGIVPYAIYDQFEKVLYLPDLDWLNKITNSDYQKWIDDFMGNNVDGRYNVLLMGNITWKKVLSLKVGTYKLNPTSYSKSIPDMDPYMGYFIGEE